MPDNGAMDKNKPRRGGDRATAGYLKRLGERIRDARAQRGMTRRTLVGDSGVSERFLAQLETGAGNPSVLVLRQIAEALGVPVEDLISDNDIRSVDYRLIVRTLDRLQPDELVEARRLLAGRFARTRGAKENFVALIGLRGAGKTTLGSKVAEQLDMPFVELNREVERDCGASIGEILALSGQAGYLRYERQALEKIISTQTNAVIEIGGGLATDPETLDLLLETTQTVWMSATPEEHMQRVIAQGDLRPMANNAEAMQDLRAILAAREPFYRKAALHLDTSGKTPTQCFRELLKLLRSVGVAPSESKRSAE